MSVNKVLAALVVLAVAAAVAPVPAATSVDDVVAKHIEARGGDRWSDIDTLEITGSYTAFSITEPFTLLRKRDAKFHLDAYFVSSRRVIAFDGETAWNSSEDGPEAIDGLDRAVLVRDTDFPTPFFGYKENDYEVKLLGEVELDGMDAIGLELTRPDGHSETWYLDPETFLEMARVSPGNDWLGPVEKRTFYDDFREVDGVMVPFRTESEWYTRSRIMEVDEVVTNVEIDDAIFRMPAPLGMEPLQSLAGTWDVSISQRQSPEGAWQDSERQATIDALMRGGLLEESFTTDSGIEVVRTISYDRFNEAYRVTQIDNRRNQLNIQEGQFGDDGKLIVSNVETGTSFTSQGRTIHGRVSFFEITDDGFLVEYERSVDGGESWFVNAKATYMRAESGI
jgi:hypothetical protein